MSPDQSPHHARARQILDELAGIGYALPGRIAQRTTTCGKLACRCKADPPQPHGPYTSWMRRTGGQPATRNLTPEQEQRYQPWIDNNRRLRQLAADYVAEVQALSIQAAETAEGWQPTPAQRS